jgi:hypothetical protein
VSNIRKTLILIALFLFFFSLVSNVQGAVTISRAYPSSQYAFSRSYVIFSGLVTSSTSSVINCTLLVDNVQKDIAYNILNNTYFYLNTSSLTPGKHTGIVRCTDNGWINNATYTAFFHTGGLLTECLSRLVESGGYYYMSSDILDGSSWLACFVIMNNSITVDCNNKRLVKTVSPPSNYRQAVGYDSGTYYNISVRNCIIENWGHGVVLTAGSNNSIYNVKIYNTAFSGILLASNNSYIYNVIVNTTSSGYDGIQISTDNIILRDSIVVNSGNNGVNIGSDKNNITIVNVTSMNNSNSGLAVVRCNASIVNSTFIYNNYGIYLESPYQDYYVNISGVNISSNRIGIYSSWAGSITIVNSIISNNTNYGFYAYYIRSALVYNNIFNNTVNFMPVYYSGVRYWNTTLQPGYNIWNSSLGYIGGNLWTNPNGNDYSDICNDTDYNGFCDDPYIINSTTGDIDYLPIAKYVGQIYAPPSFSVVFNYNSVDFGTVTPNTIAEAKSINYNVSITSSSDYKVSVNATDWSGATTIPANTLYFAVNDTLDKLSFATAKQLSNAVQLIATFPSTVTTNYHAFYFNVPLVPIGTYTATVTITYEVV